MLCLGPKKSFHHRGSNSQPKAWRSVPIIRAEWDTTQLFRHPRVKAMRVKRKKGTVTKERLFLRPIVPLL